MELKIKAMQMDLARQKEEIPFIKSFFDYAKECGYNTVILYLENAIRTSSTSFFSEDDTYSVDEMKGIVEYGNSIGLDIVPSIQNLSHLEKFFAYKELKDLSEDYDGTTPRYRNKCTVGCVSNKKLEEFFDKYYKEIIPIFNSEYVICGYDELFDFCICKKCRTRYDTIEKKCQKFYEYVMHTYNIIKQFNKTMIMCDDWFENLDIVDKLPRDIILKSWHYAYMSDEPNGHWLGRIKRDSFAYYDKLGFRYLLALYGHRASSTYNADSFYEYVSKHNPIGVITTFWCRSTTFYPCSYPNAYYVRKKFDGEIQTYEDAVDTYASMFDNNREIAKLLLSFDIMDIQPNNTPLSFTENDTMIMRMNRNSLLFFIQSIKPYISQLEGLKKDMLLDIYDHACTMYINSLLNKLGESIFNEYEMEDCNLLKFLPKVEEIKNLLIEVKDNANYFVKKYRPNMLSSQHTVEKFYQDKLDMIENITQKIKENKKQGEVYFNYAMADLYGTVKVEIKVKYIGSDVEQTVYNNVLKSCMSYFEYAGSFGARFAIENKQLEYVKLSTYGEGVMYPQNIRYFANGKKYTASFVESISGNVQNECKILKNDTSFATFGSDNFLTFVDDIESTRKPNTVIVKFKEL